MLGLLMAVQETHVMVRVTHCSTAGKDLALAIVRFDYNTRHEFAKDHTTHNKNAY